MTGILRHQDYSKSSCSEKCCPMVSSLQWSKGQTALLRDRWYKSTHAEALLFRRAEPWFQWALQSQLSVKCWESWIQIKESRQTHARYFTLMFCSNSYELFQSAALSLLPGLARTLTMPVLSSIVLHSPPLCTCLPGQEEETPLHCAAWHGYDSVARVLCEAGCNVNIKNREGETPLLTASARGYHDIVECLAEHGADLNASDKVLSGSMYPARWKVIWGAGGTTRLLS